MIKLPEPSAEVDGCVASGNYNKCCRALQCTRRTAIYTESQMRQAIKDALEAAAKVCDSLIHYGEVSGVLCAKAIRAAIKGQQL